MSKKENKKTKDIEHKCNCGENCECEDCQCDENCNCKDNCECGDECHCGENCSCHDEQKATNELLSNRVKELEDALLRSQAEL